MIGTLRISKNRSRRGLNGIKRGHYRTPDEICSLIRAFEAGTLPRSEWTHAAHLTVALWYLLRAPEGEATGIIRDAIKRYNAHHGIVMTKENGYHETITLFWIRAVSRYLLSKTNLRCTLVSLANGLIRECGDGRLPFEYYSRDRLMSWEARVGWVEPDLKRLDS